jgi:hypothetical protein
MKKFTVLAAATAVVVVGAGVAQAAPYASNVTISGGTAVSFILNENSSTLSYSINGGAPIALDGTTKGTKTFNLGSPTDTFSITASKFDATGYKFANGGSAAVVANGLSQITPTSGFRLVSDDSNVLGRFNSPRGVSVSNNPNATNFGTAYIANSAAGTIAANATNVTAPARTLTGDGLYAVRADVTDAFGYGNVGQNPGSLFDTASASSPFRATVGSDGNVYVADFSDSRGNAYRLNQNLTSNANLLAAIGGPTALPAGQNHGSTTAVVPVLSAGGLTLYTLDEDLTTTQTGAGTGVDKNHLWRYDIGTGALPYGAMPTKINQNSVLLTAATSDLDIGTDGKFYLAQNRAGGAEPGVVVLNADGTTAYDSLSASRTLLANPTASDILRNVLAMDVSEDQKYLAALLNNSDIAIVPLVAGIPDLANRLVVDTGTDVISGRDIGFDAAGNLHYVSSGQGIYRIISPGGLMTSTLAYDGSQYSFTSNLQVPEPATLALLGGAVTLLLRRRK